MFTLHRHSCVHMHTLIQTDTHTLYCSSPHRPLKISNLLIPRISLGFTSDLHDGLLLFDTKIDTILFHQIFIQATWSDFLLSSKIMGVHKWLPLHLAIHLLTGAWSHLLCFICMQYRRKPSLHSPEFLSSVMSSITMDQRADVWITYVIWEICTQISHQL